MYRSTITTKGQTTIPLGIRKKLHLIPGDNIEYYAHDDGTVTIVHGSLDVSQLLGVMRKPEKIISIEEMNNIVAKRRMTSGRC